jgi:hypothetical protein
MRSHAYPWWGPRHPWRWWRDAIHQQHEECHVAALLRNLVIEVKP